LGRSYGLWAKVASSILRKRCKKISVMNLIMIIKIIIMLMDSIKLPLQKVHYSLMLLPLILMETIMKPLIIFIKESYLTVMLFHYKTINNFL
jgi:hypothetical protein